MTYNNILCACCLLCVCSRPLCGSWGTTPLPGFWWVAGCVSSCYGGHSVEETPGSIPNPEAKLDRADGTALGRVWESRSPPDIFHREWWSAGTPQGVRLHHSLLSCPKQDAPVRDRAPLRWSEDDEEGPAGARSVMAGSASCPRRFPRARRRRDRGDAERPRRPMHAVPTDRRRSRQPRVDPPRGPDPAGPGRRRGRRRC